MEAPTDVYLPRLNTFLSDIGVSMRLSLPRNSTDRDADTIAADALTAGVSVFKYAAFNPITGGTGVIFEGNDAMVAYETLFGLGARQSPPSPQQAGC